MHFLIRNVNATLAGWEFSVTFQFAHQNVMSGMGTARSQANADARLDTTVKIATNATHIQAVSMVIVDDHGNVTASELFISQNSI